MKILVIDDDVKGAGLVAYFLKGKGFDATVALDGLNGTIQAAKTRPDLIVCDFQMPAANGNAVWERLVGMGMGGTPIVFVSALGAERVRKMMPVQAEHMRFLGKPLQFSELLAAIEELAPGSVSSRPADAPPASRPADGAPLDLDAG